MQTARTILLYNGTVTEAGAGISVPLGGSQYTAVIFRLKVGTVTGTSPTLNAFIQDGMRIVPAGAIEGRDVEGDSPTDYEFSDYGAFLQVTAAGASRLSTVGGGEEAYVETDATLTAGQIRNGPIGNIVRVKFAVGGTNPSFPVTVIAQFTP